jgi:hypothetical protein
MASAANISKNLLERIEAVSNKRARFVLDSIAIDPALKYCYAAA